MISCDEGLNSLIFNEYDFEPELDIEEESIPKI